MGSQEQSSWCFVSLCGLLIVESYIWFRLVLRVVALPKVIQWSFPQRRNETFEGNIVGPPYGCHICPPWNVSEGITCDSSLTVSESFSDPQDLSATQDLPRFFHSPARSCSLHRIWSYQHCFLPFVSLVSQNLFQNSEHSPFHAFVPSLFFIFLVDCCMLSAAFHAGSLSSL